MKRFKQFAIACLTLIWIGSGSEAFGIGISAEIDKRQIPFEETVLLTVTVSWEGEQFLYQFDAFPMPELEMLEILSTSSSSSTRIGTADKTEETVQTYTYKLAPSNYGQGAIMPIKIVARHRETGTEYPLLTGRLEVTIDRPKPKEIETSDSGALWWVIIIVVVVTGGATAAIIILKRKSRKAEHEKVPEQEYIDELTNIKRETVSDGKLFYSRLFRLLVRYLEAELDLSVSGKTGDEILAVVKELKNEETKLSLIVWLEKINRVKYSPSTPPAGDVEEMYSAVRYYLENKKV